MDTRTVFVMAALTAGGLLLVGGVVGLFFVHSGPRRAGLVAAALPLALILPTLAVCYGSFSLINAFSGMAVSGGDASAVITAQSRHVWTTVRGAAGIVAMVALLALVLGLVPARERPGGAACSLRRALVLLVLPLCALALSVGLTRQLRSAVRIAQVVVMPANDDAGKAAVERLLASEGLGGLTGIGSIAAISDSIALRSTLGSVGALPVLVVLIGLSLTGALLAAPVRMGGGFVAAASLLWLLVALAASAIAAGLGDPLRLA